MNKFTEKDFWEAVQKVKRLPTKTSYPIPKAKALPKISKIELIEHVDMDGILLRAIATSPCGERMNYINVRIDDTSILDDPDFWKQLLSQLKITKEVTP